MKKFVLGFVVGILVIGLGAYIFLNSGVFPMGADNPAGGLEKFAARSLIRAWMRSAPQQANPIPLSDENLVAGGKLYKNNCEGCHGGLEKKENLWASSLNPPAPQFAEHGVDDDPDGRIFMVTKHGIRMTGMPANGSMLKDDEIWSIVLFLKNFNHIPPGVAQQLAN